MSKTYDVAIIGSGVTGSAILYTLSKYTNIKSAVLIEKEKVLGGSNSYFNNNSQTLHVGDIETNYTVEKAAKVKVGAELVATYVEKSKKPIFRKIHKMVLAVGDKEVKELEERYEKFKVLFPTLRKIYRDEIARLEPKVVEGRDPKQKICALYNPNGYAIDFGALSTSLIDDACKSTKTMDVVTNTKITRIEPTKEDYILHTKKKEIKAKVVIVAAAANSLLFAHKLGYGKEFILLPVAGNFFSTKNVLNGKVYTMQIPKLPFAAVHGDPDVRNPHETRFGPTAKVLPMMERHHYDTTLDFIRLVRFRLDAIISLLKIISDPVLFKYLVRNVIYDLPFIGTRAFLSEIRKVVPSLRVQELKRARGVGGIRPQIVNTKTKSLDFGTAKIHGKNILFNITPSPGASMCLGNAFEDVKTIMGFFDGKYKFDEKKFKKEGG